MRAVWNLLREYADAQPDLFVHADGAADIARPKVRRA